MIQTSLGLKLEGRTLRTGLRAAAAASASCFAARRAALLFVRGRIVGAAMLLGRGLGLAAAAAGVAAVVVEVVVVAVIFSEVTVEGLVVALIGRIAATEEARLKGYSEGVAFTTEAWDAGRCIGTRGGLKELFEFVLESAGVLGATGSRTEADELFKFEQGLELSNTYT